MRRWVFSLPLGLLLSSASLWAQGYDPSKNGHVYEGDHVPKFYVISHFFERLFFYYSQPDHLSAYHEQLKALGIKPGSKMEQVLTETMLEAHRILNPPPTAFEGDWGKYRKDQLRDLRKKAVGLKSVYKGLELEMKEQGIEIKLLRAYIKQKVQPEVQIITIGGPIDDDQTQIMEEFESDLP